MNRNNAPRRGSGTRGDGVGTPRPRRALAQLLDRKLTDLQVADLITFLGALECPNKLEPPAALP